MATCKSYADLAATVMEARQKGIAMSKLMATNESGDRIIEQFIIQAYDQPRMNVEENQQRMIRDFENDIYLACVKEIG